LVSGPLFGNVIYAISFGPLKVPEPESNLTLILSPTTRGFELTFNKIILPELYDALENVIGAAGAGDGLGLGDGLGDGLGIGDGLGLGDGLGNGTILGAIVFIRIMPVILLYELSAFVPFTCTISVGIFVSQFIYVKVGGTLKRFISLIFPSLLLFGFKKRVSAALVKTVPRPAGGAASLIFILTILLEGLSYCTEILSFTM